MKRFRTLTLPTLLTLLLTFVLLGGSRTATPVLAQGYSGALPNVTAAAGTSLRLPYTAGIVPSGGTQTSITADGTGLLATGSMTSCLAPGYTACNFVYWTSGSSLSVTTTASTAFAAGNVVVAFVTTTSNDINVITPASWSPATAAVGTLRPTGSNTGLAYFIPPGACNSSVSGNSTGTNGLTVLGTAPSIPVVQAQTSASGTNTHYFTCNITPPTTVGVTGRGVNIVDAVFFYGVQTTGLGTQVAVLASGTMNAKTVFTKILYPVSGASETATGLAEAVRSDAGTLVITPVVGSFNVATTTAGEFFAATFAPATPFAAATDLTQYYLTVGLLNTATSATITNSPGVLVHYTN